MIKPSTLFSVNQRWVILFGLWLLFLSGIFANFVGSPGIVQGIRLRSLLTEKNQQLNRAQQELQKLQLEVTQLETSKTAQEREIRKVLGYAASDEIIFDFNLAD